jgi:hypothetical protein
MTFVRGKVGTGEKVLLLHLLMATKQWNLPRATKQWNLSRPPSNGTFLHLLPPLSLEDGEFGSLGALFLGHSFRFKF